MEIKEIEKLIDERIKDGFKKNKLFIVMHPDTEKIIKKKFGHGKLVKVDTGFEFKTDLFFAGVPVFVDKDCSGDECLCVARDDGEKLI